MLNSPFERFSIQKQPQVRFPHRFPALDSAHRRFITAPLLSWVTYEASHCMAQCSVTEHWRADSEWLGFDS